MAACYGCLGRRSRVDRMREKPSIAEELIQSVEAVGIVHILDELDWYDIISLYTKACRSIGREPARVSKHDVPRHILNRQLREDLMVLDLMEDDDPERNGLLDEDNSRLLALDERE